MRSLGTIKTQYNLTFKMAVSLVDYDPKNKAKEAPDTPRSIEACRRIGWLPTDLIHKTRDAFAIHFGGDLDKSLIKEQYQIYETRLAENVKNA